MQCFYEKINLTHHRLVDKREVALILGQLALRHLPVGNMPKLALVAPAALAVVAEIVVADVVATLAGTL